MTTADAWNYAAPGSAYRPAHGWTGRTRYTPADFITLLWRERFLMGFVFVALFGLGLAFAFTLTTKYEASTSISVRLGREHTYQPPAGDAARGATMDVNGQVALEVEYLMAPDVRERVIQRIGLNRIYPSIPQGKTPAERRKALEDGVTAMFKDLTVGSAADTPVIRVSYKHANPDMAARVLNAFLQEYLAYRQVKLVGDDTAAIQNQRQTSEGRLQTTDAALNAFLTFNDIADFDGERDALKLQQGTLETQRYALTSTLAERQAALAAVSGQLSATPAETLVYRDVNQQYGQQEAKLREEIVAAESTYRPDSQKVLGLKAELAALLRAQAASPITSDAARRMGPNPLHQDLQTKKAQLTADVAGVQKNLATVNESIRQVADRQMRLTTLEPQYRALAQEQGILQGSVKDFATREQESFAANIMARAGAGNIRVVAAALPPAHGSSLKKPVAVLALLFAGFTALCAGLLRIFLRPGQMTPQSAGRALDLPLLASARARH